MVAFCVQGERHVGSKMEVDCSSHRLCKSEVESRTQGSRPRPRTQKKIRGQGQPFRGQTLLRPRTGMFEAKAKDRGHKRKCSTKKKKRSSQKFFRRSPQKNVFQKIFQALHNILTIQKNSAVLEPRTGQFSRTWGLEAKAKDFKMWPRGRPRGQGRPRELHLWSNWHFCFGRKI